MSSRKILAVPAERKTCLCNPSRPIIKIALILAIFFAMAAFDFSSAANENKDNEVIKFELEKDKVSPDSPFLNPNPRIDPEAAEIVKEDGGKKNYDLLLAENNHCLSLPQNFWVFLLGAYVFLILFNLSYEFGRRRKIQWFWESLYTILALLAWYNFDECRKNTWFAPSIIESAVVIYGFYLYFWNKFNKKTPLEKESPGDNQEKLDLK